MTFEDPKLGRTRNKHHTQKKMDTETNGTPSADEIVMQINRKGRKLVATNEIDHCAYISKILIENVIVNAQTNAGLRCHECHASIIVQ